MEDISFEINNREESMKLLPDFDTPGDKEDTGQSEFYPYKSMPSLLLHQWWKSDGSTCSKTAFNILCKLLKKMVQMYPNSNEWPSSIHKLEKPFDLTTVCKTYCLLVCFLIS